MTIEYTSKVAPRLAEELVLDRQDEMRAAELTETFNVIALCYSGRLSRQISLIQQQVKFIAPGQTRPVDEQGPDEISDLAHSVNLKAADLMSMKQPVTQAERTRLSIQLVHGSAHELWNGIRSARLSLKMFREGAVEVTASPLFTTSDGQLCMTELLVQRMRTVTGINRSSME